MNCRCVKFNASNIVAAIGRDEGQGGQDYNGIGTWCDFIFSDNLVPSQSLEDEAIAKGYDGSLLVVKNNSVRLMTTEEIPT